MGVATTTTEATMSAIQASLVKLSVSLVRIAARQDQMLIDLKKTTAALTPSATTSLVVMPGQAAPQLATSPSSPMVSHDGQVSAGATPCVPPALSSAMPTRCLTFGLGVNTGSNHAAVTFPSGDNTQAAGRVPCEPSLVHPPQPGMALKLSMLTPTAHPSKWSLDNTETVLSCTPPVIVVPVGSTTCTTNQPLDEVVDEEVLTTIGGSLFPKLSKAAAGEVEKTLAKDVRWDGDTGDSVLTQIGGLSLFLEQPMDSLEKPEVAADTSIFWDHVASGVQLGYLILPPQVVNSSDVPALPWDPVTTGDATHDPKFSLPYATSSVKLSSPWDPGKQDLTYIGLNGYIGLVILWAPVKWRKTILADSLGKAGGGLAPSLQLIFHSKIKIGPIRHLFPSMFHLIDITRPWDPGTSWFRVSHCMPHALYLMEVVPVLPYSWSRNSGNAHLLFHHWQDKQWPKLNEFANISAAANFTKDYSIKHVIADPTYLPTTECICDDKFRPPVVVLLNNDFQIMEIYPPATVVAVYCRTYGHPPTRSKHEGNAEYGVTMCCSLKRPLLGGKQCFFGAVMSCPHMDVYLPSRIWASTAGMDWTKHDMDRWPKALTTNRSSNSERRHR